MRTLLLATVAAGGLLAAPAVVAQSNNQQQGQSKAAAPQNDPTMAMSQERLLKSLQGAGFTDVTVVDATYLVRARGPEGNQVTMLIDPPQASMAQSGGGQGEGQGQGTSKQQ